ncbi:MAG: UvrD-helicase domain-containing protein [Acidobacteria bacterium]|nr:UvrD-helicase domain-containing protein [Acidobacteriota bacterium]
MGLTDDQRDAAHAPTSVAVTAGAGTGKTHMLAERYLFHMQEQLLSPLEIVAITFTDRAANELRSRIRSTVIKQFPERPGREDLIAELEAAQVSTIHSLCARICRDHPDESGAPHEFEIIDEASGAILISEWFLEALDSLPMEVFEDVPFSLLKDILNALLSDPVMAERALEQGPELWPQLSADALAQLRNQLRQKSEYLAAVDTLRLLEGQNDDLMEINRQTALDATSQIDEEGERFVAGLEILMNMNMRGGSAKKWPPGGLTEIRETLKVLRTIARDLYDLVDALKIAEVDERFAVMLPALRIAFNHVRGHLEQAKHSARMLDFADLEECALRALQSESVRRYYRDRWRAFLVDEFQDTNPIQAEILDLLAADGHLTIVGDEKQSIYGFRRADVEVFQRFKDQIENGGGIHRALSLSFRAHLKLTERFNLIFSSLLERAHQPLDSIRIESPHDGPHVRVFTVTAERGVSKPPRQRTEARMIATLIKEMIDDRLEVHDRQTGMLRPICPADIAILSRTWDPLDVYAEALSSAGVPAVHMGGGSLLETREAVDALALLRFLSDPNDDLALVAVLRSPFFAVSDRSLFGCAQMFEQGKSWWEHLTSTEVPDLIFPVTVMRQLVESRHTESPVRLLQLTDRLTGYRAVIANLSNGERREADWRCFLEFIMSIERACGDDLFVLMRKLRHLINSEIKVARPPLEAREAVSLMTIHGAKGLEWPVVIVPDLARKRNIQNRSVYFDQHRGVGIRLSDEEGQTEKTMLHTLLELEQRKREEDEARRLLYVALTRSRDRVILTATDVNGGYLDYLLDGIQAAGIPIESIEHDPLDSLPFPLPVVGNGSKDLRILID